MCKDKSCVIMHILKQNTCSKGASEKTPTSWKIRSYTLSPEALRANLGRHTISTLRCRTQPSLISKFDRISRIYICLRHGFFFFGILLKKVCREESWDNDYTQQIKKNAYDAIISQALSSVNGQNLAMLHQVAHWYLFFKLREWGISTFQ